MAKECNLVLREFSFYINKNNCAYMVWIIGLIIDVVCNSKDIMKFFTYFLLNLDD